VYADWLDEHGQANYAAFIRLQCEAARHRFWTPEANALWERIGDVWNRLADEWWPAVHPGWSEVHDPHNFNANYAFDAVHFDRGFLRESVPLDFGRLAWMGESCWPWLPLPTTFAALTDLECDRTADWPRLARVRRLRLWNRLWPEPGREAPLEDVLESPHLRNIESLEVFGEPVTEWQYHESLTPERFPRLREVKLTVFCGATDPPFTDNPTPHSEYERNQRAIESRLKARFETVLLKFGWY
jgi:hypothetical protein